MRELTSNLRDIEVGLLEPYPDVQRPLQSKKWDNKVGKFDTTAVGTVTLCPNGQPNRFYVIDGQHRVAKMLQQHGSKATIHAEVFSRMLTKEEAAGSFRRRNTGVAVSTAVMHNRGVVEGDPNSLFVQSILDQLPATRAIKPFYMLLRRMKRQEIQATINWLLEIWGPKVEYPGMFVTAAAKLRDRTVTPRIKKAFRVKTPSQWVTQARTKLLQTVGARAPLSEYVMRVLERHNKH